MARYTDHRFVRLLFRQGTGIDAVDFKKIGSCLHPRSLISIKVRLAFSDMKSIGRGDFIEIAATVEIYVLRLGYSRLKRMFAAKSVQATPRVDLIPVDRVNLFAGQKERLLLHEGIADAAGAYSARRRNKPACTLLVFRWASLNRPSGA